MILIQGVSSRTGGETWQRGFDSMRDALDFVDDLAASGVDWQISMTITPRSRPIPPDRPARSIQRDFTSGG